MNCVVISLYVAISNAHAAIAKILVTYITIEYHGFLIVHRGEWATLTVWAKVT